MFENQTQFQDDSHRKMKKLLLIALAVLVLVGLVLLVVFRKSKVKEMSPIANPSTTGTPVDQTEQKSVQPSSGESLKPLTQEELDQQQKAMETPVTNQAKNGTETPTAAFNPKPLTQEELDQQNAKAPATTTHPKPLTQEDLDQLRKK